MTCRKSCTTCFPVKRDLNCYIELNERHNKTGNKSNALHQWTRTAYLYQSSTSVQSQIPVAESASECFISALWHE